MTPRLLAVRSVRSLAGGIRYSSRGIATEVQHASTSTSIVDDAPGPSRSTSKVRRTKLKDVIPHDPRRASLRGKVGFGLSVPSTKSAVLADKASKHRKKDGPVRSKDVKPRVRTENPFVLAPRLVEIYRKHGPEKALTELATSKREARTVPVHNILIKLLLKDGWIDTAYKVWMDMKRMGLVPTPMSYTIFFSGVDFNKPLSRDAKERINTIWKQWQSYCEKAADPNDSMHELAQTPEYRISSIPTNAYLASFPKVGSDISRLSELVDSLSSSPSFVPTAHTFSVIFRSVSTSLSSSTQTDQTEHATRCYELCRKAWDFMYDSWQSNGLQLDALALSAAVTAYREIFKAAPFLFSQELKQRLLDQLEALIGLQRTESTAEDMPTVHAKAPKKMDSTVIYDAMVLASAFEGRYSGHILDWFTTLRQHEPTLLDARVCEMYMKAAPRSALETLVYMLRSPSTAMRPSLSTYTTAISLSPFIDQVRIIAHMSGRSEILEASEAPLLQTKMETFDQERALSKRALEKGYHTKHIQPDNKIMAILLQTALDLQDWRRIDRAVKIATIFSANGVVNGTTTASEPMKAVKYALRLSENMAEACDKLLTNPAVPEARKEELRSMQKQQVTRRRPRLSTSSWSR